MKNYTNIQQIYEYLKHYQFKYIYRRQYNIQKQIILKPNSLIEIQTTPQYIIDKYKPHIYYKDINEDFDMTKQDFKLYSCGRNLPCRIQWFAYYSKSNILVLDNNLDKNKEQKMYLVNGQILPEFKHLYKNVVMPEQKLKLKIEKYSLIINQIMKIKYNNKISTFKLMNLPFNIYKNFQLYGNGLLYNITRDQWYSNKKTKTQFLNILFDIAKNGLNNLIMIQHYKNNYFYKEAMTKFYIARLLQLPFIPSIIINKDDFYIR